MKQKLNCILLIDDDEATNFLSEIVIEEVDCAEKVVAVQSGQKALDYLRSKEDGEHPCPDLIFLDINMPGMNGWEFLEQYKQLDKEQQGKIIMVMLTTSVNPDDAQKAKTIDIIDDYKNKPMTVEVLQEILEKYFPEKL